ncbi:MAG: type I DNA topoisomerase [Ezakiella sp.]|nr:type I DNA topoisomerase [Ezakiella sp.]
MDLIIVESPTKARTIQRFLGKNAKVMATKGHIRDLPKSRLGVDVDTFEPEYINIRGKAPLINELKAEAKKADRVFIATDNDREGEAIAWHMAYLLNEEDEENRIEFNEITKNSIKEAIKHPRKIDINLVNAQQARRVLDRVVGYNLSPVLWKKVKSKLSAGRVQSVALMLICDREEEIRNFIPQEYWTIEAVFKEGDGKIVFDLKQILEDGKFKAIEINTKLQADNILKELKSGKFIVTENKETKRSKKPFPPFTTSLLQQAANRVLGFKSGRTMQIAQGLYEGKKVGAGGEVGLITYMRTDSYRLSEEAISSAQSFIKSNYGEEYYEGPKHYHNKKKGTQDAHEAIRPTDVNRTPESIRQYLSDEEYKLYKLIWNRFIATQMADAKILKKSIELTNGIYRFKSQAEVILFDGYMKATGIESGFNDIDFSAFKKGLEVNPNKLNANQNFTKPPARFSEASLIKTLEEEGIGRPSTYAPTITTLINRLYIKVKEKLLVPTELGEIVNNILKENFPSVINVKFTAGMEDMLDEVSEGKEDWKKALRDFYKDFKVDLDKAEASIKEVELVDEVSDVKCEHCGRMMVYKNSKFGRFLACPGFPECKNTKSIEDRIGIKCPKCNKGEVIKKRSKRGRIFFGCNQYPECDFASFEEPTKEKCPICGGVLTRKNYSKYWQYKCLNCEYEEKRDKE